MGSERRIQTGYRARLVDHAGISEDLVWPSNIREYSIESSEDVLAMIRPVITAGLLLAGAACLAADGPPQPTRTPSVRAVDLEIGESSRVLLGDGSTATIKLLDLDERRDPIRDAAREAKVRVEVDG